MRIATFDIGTTAVKGVLVDEQGTILMQADAPVDTFFEGDFKEQDAAQWYEAFCSITRKFTQESAGQESQAADASAEKTASKIDAVIMSGQMQDVIPVGADGLPTGRVILYSDGRAEAEAQELIGIRGEQYLKNQTGNHYDGSLSLPKIMWIKKHDPQQYEQTACFLISAKDYVIYRLSGVFAGDGTACATAGAMDLKEKKWDEEILKAAGIAPEKMPKLYLPHEVVGSVQEAAARETGIPVGCPVYAGIGDAGATTLASGIANPGEYNINLGTSGWVAGVSDTIMDLEGGMFNLAAFSKDTFINIVPFLNAGNVHKWITSVCTGAESMDYGKIEEVVQKTPAGSNGVFFLPYLNGERFPVMDTQVKGTYAGITAATEQKDMIRACLEGVAFSIRQGLKRMELPPKKISVIGGGARSVVWCQILADVLGQEIIAFKNADVLPALALSSLVLMQQGLLGGYDTISEHYQQEQYATVYKPDQAAAAKYEEVYAKYLKLYPAVKLFYE